MVLGYRREGRGVDLSPLEHMLAGGASSSATRALCQPLDVLKIRLQLQLESGAKAKYRSLPQTAAAIFREEGAAAFWKGHLPAQALSITYGVAQFASFEALTRTVAATKQKVHSESEEVSSGSHAACGAAAGVCGTLASYPFDVVRTRLVAQGKERVYRGTIDAASTLLRTEGPRGLFRGIVPTFWTIAPYSGLQFGFYSFFSKLLRLDRKADSSGGGGFAFSLTSIISGGLAGLCAKVAVYPFDTTKKRLQVAGFEAGRRDMGRTGAYNGMVHCLSEIVRWEGLRGLFKGLSPGLIKAVATTSINFWLYELCTDALAAKR